MAWYVVYRGRVPGVYATWARCNVQVIGFKNNSYKSFPNKEEAEASYLEFMGCEDDKVFYQSSTKGAQEQTCVICCGCGAVFSVAGAPVVRSCSLLQLSVMLRCSKCHGLVSCL